MKQNGTKRLTISYLALTAALLALFMLNIFCGSTALSPKDILSTLFSAGNNALAQKIIFGLRLPRAAMVVLLGAALSVAGYLLQTFFANPIAGRYGGFRRRKARRCTHDGRAFKSRLVHKLTHADFSFICRCHGRYGLRLGRFTARKARRRSCYLWRDD